MSLGSAASTFRVKLSSLSTSTSSTAESWRQDSDSPGGMTMDVLVWISPAALEWKVVFLTAP